MNKDEIQELFEKYSASEITKQFKKSEITAMYITVYDAKPLSANTKLNTVQDIKNYYAGIRRAKSLHKGFSVK